MKGVFYSTGGSEAVEGALKLARTHARRSFSHAKHGIVALVNSYHGRTYGSLSVTGQEKYRMDFGPGLPHVTFVHRNNLAELRAAVTNETARFLWSRCWAKAASLNWIRSFWPRPGVSPTRTTHC